MYKAMMCLGYSASFVVGMLTYFDAAYAFTATCLISGLYTIDSMGCCFGVTCMRSVPAKNVLYHHLPALCICLPGLYFQQTGRAYYYDDLHWVFAAANVTSFNEALWVASSFFTPETLAGKPYRIGHACVTTCVLAQFIVVSGVTSLTHLSDDRPLIVVAQLYGILVSIVTIQLKLFVNVVGRLGILLKN